MPEYSSGIRHSSLLPREGRREALAFGRGADQKIRKPRAWRQMFPAEDAGRVLLVERCRMVLSELLIITPPCQPTAGQRGIS